MSDTPEKMFVRFNDYAPSIDAASIRKWSTSKFDGGTEYTRTPPKAEPTDGAPETILITPLGLNPKTCADCGEWDGASKALCSSTRRHAKTADKFSQYRDISDARIDELTADLRDIEAEHNHHLDTSVGVILQAQDRFKDQLATARNDAHNYAIKGAMQEVMAVGGVDLGVREIICDALEALKSEGEG